MTIRVQLGADRRGRAHQPVLVAALTCPTSTSRPISSSCSRSSPTRSWCSRCCARSPRSVSPSARASVTSWARAVAPQSVVFAWIVATVTTLGSLYYSEHAGFVPCELCWYQRIVMYPLVIVLGVAALRRDRAVWITDARVRGHRRAALAVPLAGRAGAGVRGEQLVLGDHAVQRAVVREARVRHAGVDGDERVPADRGADGVHVARRPRPSRRDRDRPTVEPRDARSPPKRRCARRPSPNANARVGGRGEAASQPHGPVGRARGGRRDRDHRGGRGQRRRATTRERDQVRDRAGEGHAARRCPQFDVERSPDPAIGKTVPTLTGKSVYDGGAVTIGPDTGGGKPQVIVFVAHWCPHCQAEVPRLVALAKRRRVRRRRGQRGGDRDARPGRQLPAVGVAEERGLAVPGDGRQHRPAPRPRPTGSPPIPYFVLVNADGTVAGRGERRAPRRPDSRPTSRR